MNITYYALTDDNRRLAIDCATLNEALDLAAAHLRQNVLPVALEIEGRRVDIEMIVALLDERARRAGG